MKKYQEALTRLNMCAVQFDGIARIRFDDDIKLLKEALRELNSAKLELKISKHLLDERDKLVNHWKDRFTKLNELLENIKGEIKIMKNYEELEKTIETLQKENESLKDDVHRYDCLLASRDNDIKLLNEKLEYMTNMCNKLQDDLFIKGGQYENTNNS